MVIKQSTILNSDVDCVFKEALKTDVLLYISKPFIVYKELDDYPLPYSWNDNRFKLKMYFYGVIPLGFQEFDLSIDYKNHIFTNKGCSRLLGKWEHTITAISIDDNHMEYRDEMKLKAGLKTPLVMLFMKIYFKFRHNKWKKLVDNDFVYK